MNNNRMDRNPYYPPPLRTWQPPEGTWQPQAQQPQQPQPQWQPPPPQQPYPQQPPQPWQQPPMYPYPAPIQQQFVMPPQQVVNVNVGQQRQHGLFVRALYFVFIGSWLGFVWLHIGYCLVVSGIGLPLGLMMLNRLPGVMTLKPASQSVNINVSGNVTNITIGGTRQLNFLLRTLYFIFIGSWAGLMWAYLAYLMFLMVVTIPVGVMMCDMLPAIITLRKN